jgi:hypothetical protein
MSESMRECPFCGKTLSSSYQLGSGQFGYGCNAADCGGEMNGYKSREEAVTAWNTRALEDALRAERDAAQAEAARYRALWESVPWSEIICMADSRQFAVDQDEMQDALDILDWAGAHAPQPQQEPQHE